MAVARINGVKLPQASISLYLAGNEQSDRFGAVMAHLESVATKAAKLAVLDETQRIVNMKPAELAKLLDDEAQWARTEAQMRAIGKSDER